ncbi:unnamed protein product [Phytophthora lilii]|uniref:Unnamed protein product n=1 Tax=Phytophthora lilii TaxID=2077276 RepID=A0A9W6X8C8_9STRA|nr:unnamed protein product [Phytophthora lilii]
MNSLGVFAVLRSWNTTHQKPFSANDQILGCLLAIQAGIILRQTAVTKTLQKINHKTHQILQMPSDIVAKASAAHNVKHMTSEVTGNPSVRSPTQSAVLSEFAAATVIPSVVQLVAVAQKELGECLGIKQLRIFVLDAGAQKFWHVGEQLPHDSGDSVIPTVVRRYVSAEASLCSLLLRTDATSMVLAEPSAEAVFNDTVDIPGGTRGLYLAPILSPWGNGALPLGVVQVARVAKARLSASPFALTTSEGAGNGIVAGSVADIVVSNEREAAQQTEDRLMLELLGLFCRVFAGLLHHVAAQQIYDSCPPEILQAQLAFLTTHLDTLAAKRMEDDECEDEAELANMSAALSPEEAIQVDRSLNSRQSGRHSSVTSIRTSKQSYNIRRVVSADPKHRASPTSRRATSSPSHNPYISGRDKTSHQHELKALHNWEASQRGDFDVGANDGDATATITNTVVADATGAASRDREICKQESEHDLLVSDQAHEIVDVSEQAMLGDATSNHVSSSGNLAPTSDASAVTPDAEQPSSEGDTRWNWGAGDANDSASWSGGENVGGFEEGTAWEYGAVEDATLPNDEDDDSRKMWGGSHISTNSTYAIDLHLSSRNTSSAETEEPSGAL